MTNLDNSSGKKTGSKRNMATNRHAKKAMINATMQHSRNAEESSIYLKKKISQGKKYKQAILITKKITNKSALQLKINLL